MYIIYDHLYLSKFSEINEQILKELDITCIINLSQMLFEMENIKIFNINIPDYDDINISKYFNKTNKFITNNFIKGKKILVCCLGCISRSPTIIIAYLIRKRHMNFKESYNFLLKINSKICPNEGFIKQLKSY